MVQGKQKISFFTVMVSPGAFIKSPLAQKRGYYWLLAFVVGFLYLLGKANLIGAGYEHESYIIMLASLILSIPVGWLIFYVASFSLYWVGKLFRGVATFDNVMRAFVWSRVPEVFQLAVWMIAILYWDWIVFTDIFTPYQGAPLFLTFFFIAQFILVIWKVFILFQTLAVVQGYSPWMAVWNVLLTWLVLVVIDYYITWLLGTGYSCIYLSMRLFLQI